GALHIKRAGPGRGHSPLDLRLRDDVGGIDDGGRRDGRHRPACLHNEAASVGHHILLARVTSRRNAARSPLNASMCGLPPSPGPRYPHAVCGASLVSGASARVRARTTASPIRRMSTSVVGGVAGRESSRRWLPTRGTEDGEPERAVQAGRGLRGQGPERTAPVLPPPIPPPLRLPPDPPIQRPAP